MLERGGLGGSLTIDDPSQVAALSRRVDGLMEELKLVESRMRGEGFVNMDHTFLSMMDVKTWSATYFRQGHFEYTIDAVSMLSFMPGI